MLRTLWLIFLSSLPNLLKVLLLYHSPWILFTPGWLSTFPKNLVTGMVQHPSKALLFYYFSSYYCISPWLFTTLIMSLTLTCNIKSMIFSICQTSSFIFASFAKLVISLTWTLLSLWSTWFYSLVLAIVTLFLDSLTLLNFIHSKIHHVQNTLPLPLFPLSKALTT